jgi:uncharacterized membrane protein YdbT with pleckstrin-like domain
MENQTEAVYRRSTTDVAIIFIGCFVFYPLLGLGIILQLVILIEYFTKSLTLGHSSIQIKSGLFSTTITELPYSKVHTVSVSSGVFGKMFDYGNIVIYTGNDISGIKFTGISHPQQIKATIQAKTHNA